MRSLPLLLLLAACPGEEEPTGPVTVQYLTDPAIPPGLLSVRAPGPDDVWVVGSSPEPDDDSGPTVLHYDGSAWDRVDLSEWAGSELWWAHVDGDDVILVGNDGLILEGGRDGQFTPVDGPDEGSTFFGVWGTGGDVWAVGMTSAQTSEVWRRQGGTWSAYDLGIDDFDGTVFKVHGTAADDVWMVGSQGFAAHFDGTSFTRTPTGNDTSPLLTVAVCGDTPIAVGGFGNGVILEWDGSAWIDNSVPFQPGWNGVCCNDAATWVVGQRGSRAVKQDDGTYLSDFEAEISPLIPTDWHGCDVDADGGMWAVGGRIGARPLMSGEVMYEGVATVPVIEF